MMDVIRQWFQRYFSDPQVVILALLLILGTLVIIAFGDMLAPVLASVVIAYLLEGLVGVLERRGLRRTLAVTLVFLAFMLLLLFLMLVVVPRLSAQVTQLFQQLPEMIATGQEKLMRLPERYPAFISDEQVTQLMTTIRAELAALGQRVLSLSVASLLSIITLLVYLILVPVLVFFFLKDKARILGWIAGYLPRDRALTAQVWHEVNMQIGNYVRGKVWEIFIVGGVTYATFKFMGLNYAVLLATLVGLSVVIPYIGAAAVTVPVALIAYFQFGWSADFAWILVAYGVIQALDGNVLVPLLFSEVVNLHPVAIIVAVLVFGGLWGFWGVFFAIPLATLVQAVLRAWPRRPAEDAAEPAAS
ncbi:AI-2E family transporter [Thiohalobacter sp.]|uniref:AI-2E family transporter n=1 Tax=Thiohalobacter sp. TaxID=2025948 RepID=UPI0026066E97|nr:AI-2E family transporter [Thiohalobacter sp.]